MGQQPDQDKRSVYAEAAALLETLSHERLSHDDRLRALRLTAFTRSRGGDLLGGEAARLAAFELGQDRGAARRCRDVPGEIPSDAAKAEQARIAVEAARDAVARLRAQSPAACAEHQPGQHCRSPAVEQLSSAPADCRDRGL